MRKTLLLFALFCLALSSCDKAPEKEENPFVKVNLTQISVPAEGLEDSFAITSNCYWNIAMSDPEGKPITWMTLSVSAGQANKEVFVTVSANIKTEERTAIVQITSPSMPAEVHTITVVQDPGEKPETSGYAFPICETFEIDAPDTHALTNGVIAGNMCLFVNGMVVSRSNPDGTIEFSCPSHTQPSAGDDADRSIHRSLRMDGFNQGEAVLVSFPVKDALSGDLRLMLGARACSFTKAGWSYYWGADGENWNKIDIVNAITPGSDAVWNIIYFSIPESQAIPAGGTVHFMIVADQQPSKEYIALSNTICVCPAKGEAGNVPAMDEDKIAFSTSFDDLLDTYAPDMRYPLGLLRSATTSYASNFTTFNDQYLVPDELAPFASAKGCYERPGYLQVGYYDESLWTRMCCGTYTIKIGERLKQMGVSLTDASLTLKVCNMTDFRGYENLAAVTIASGETSYVLENLKDGEFQEFSLAFADLTQDSVITITCPRLSEDQIASLDRGEKANYLQDYRFFIDDVVVELTNVKEKGTDTQNDNENFGNGGQYNW